jgi:hypothetical protein
MSIAEKLTTVYNNVPKVYEAGENQVWDYLQNYGNRMNFQKTFMGWGGEYIHPKYKIVQNSVESRNSTFQNCPNLKKIEKAHFDFSQCPRGTSGIQGWHYTFSNCAKLEVIEDVGLCNSFGYLYTFAWCYKVHTIERLGCDKETKFNNAFLYCSSLIHITIDGVIGQDIDFKDCPLDVESALSVMRALRDFRAETLDSDDGYSYLDENGNGEIDDQDILLQDSDGNVYFTFPTIYFSEHTLALLDSTDFSTYPAEELPFDPLDGWRVGVEAKGWNVG